MVTIDPADLALASEAVMLDDGLVHFDFEVELRAHEEYVIHAYSGETPEGAPVAVHATTDREEMSNWLRALVDDSKITTVADMGFALEEYREQYNQDLHDGWGDWLRGKTAREIRAARARQ